MKTVIYLEGAGDSRPSIQSCKRAFSQFFEKAGLKGRMPEIIPCGSRNKAFDVFRKSLKNPKVSDQNHLLLVDSEEPVTAPSKWVHLSNTKDGPLKKPPEATEDHVFLMVQCMEAWFLADKKTLQDFFGQRILNSALPNNPNVEDVTKNRLLDALKQFSRLTQKGAYSKSNHSFEILKRIDPTKVREASPHAEELLQTLKNLLR